jgi:hypothetical protein
MDQIICFELRWDCILAIPYGFDYFSKNKIFLLKNETEKQIELRSLSGQKIFVAKEQLQHNFNTVKMKLEKI